jgi:hypothetical protein
MVVEDLPVVSTLPDGRLLLAYLACGESEIGHRLRLAPMTIAGPSSVPSVDEAAAVELSGRFFLSLPAFTGDGRWVYAVTRPAREPVRVERFSVTDALLRSPAQALVSEPPPTPISIDGQLQNEQTASCPKLDSVGE